LQPEKAAIAEAPLSGKAGSIAAGCGSVDQAIEKAGANMGLGYLTVVLRMAEDAVPVPDARVLIKDKYGNILYNLLADSNGKTQQVALDVTDSKLIGEHYHRISSFNVEVLQSDRFGGVSIYGAEVYENLSSTLPIDMYPISLGRSNADNTTEIYVPGEHGADWRAAPERRSVPPEVDVHASTNTVKIPEYIVVHLGYYLNWANDIKVPFVEYIKNVASSEIYADWTESTLYANIYCHITFALNRIYTVWYRSQGYSFDITNDTRTDQYYVVGQTIPDNISRIVDEIFNIYVSRAGRNDPYFTQYCNGTTSTCNGLSQWGSQGLGLQGYTPIQILRYYYPDDVDLVESNEFSSNNETFPGWNMSAGMSSENIKLMQDYLNRISSNYPAIGKIPNPNGYFDSATTAAVKNFQSIFGLTADGVIGKGTWYEITRKYVAVKKLGELDSEGERIGIGYSPPNVTLSQGMGGSDKNAVYVAELQFILSYISQFVNTVPGVVENSYFDQITKDSVIGFQKSFGLPQTGVVNAATWQTLYDEYWDIKNSVSNPGENPDADSPAYPGYLLRLGSSGDAVRTLQQRLLELSKSYPSIPSVSADGNFGPGTQAAVIAFQSLFGLSADGIVGQSTWDRIMHEYNIMPDPGTPDYSYPGYMLRLGSSGEAVRIMQEHLLELSKRYPSIPAVVPDGNFGPATQAAVIAFQNLFGLSADGIIGQGTWEKIIYEYNNATEPATPDAPEYPGYLLRIGSSGEHVKMIQEYLLGLSKMYPSIPAVTPDGDFGPATQAAVIAFQNLFGLTADGIIGQGTWDRIIYEYNNPPAPAPGNPDYSYPGYLLRLGSSGEDVLIMQEHLLGLSQIYPSIPAVTPDGNFGPATQAAVIAFQNLFGLTADGIIGQGTWDRIIYEYNNPPASNLPQYPGYLLRFGSSGSDVLALQNYLNAIAQSYNTIPIVSADGDFGSRTHTAVMEFQKLFGLNPDGIVGKETWDKIASVYAGLPSGSSPAYPGGTLTVGSTGVSVQTMQNYLNEIGKVYPSIPSLTADGKFGNGTRQSVMEFQRLFGLNPDGVVGKNTWDRIVSVYASIGFANRGQYPGAALRQGDSGENVRFMQSHLNALADFYPSIPRTSVDGVFGTGMKNSVAAFQRLFGLDADGIIGKNSWDSIMAAYNASLMPASNDPCCNSSARSAAQAANSSAVNDDDPSSGQSSSDGNCACSLRMLLLLLLFKRC
jgi:peptidoglycan hydrolase-like protein with peptidoglycan-binding domain